MSNSHDDDCQCGHCERHILQQILDKIDIQNPASGDLDNDFVWSRVIPATTAWASGFLTDQDYRNITTFRPWIAGPDKMQTINLPNGAKYPYALIEAGNRSIELIDDMSGLTVLAAGPGQRVSGVIGEAASWRVLIGPGPSEAAVAIRFSSRPLTVPDTAASGPIPLTNGIQVITLTAATEAAGMFGMLRNPSGARALGIHVRVVSASATATLFWSCIGGPFPSESPPFGELDRFGSFVNADGFATGSPAPDAVIGWAYGPTGAEFELAPVPRDFGISFEAGADPAPPATIAFQAWYELVY